jgi:phosphoglycolate phosphatase
MAFANVIFDFDGTLTDSKADIARAQLWVLQQLGVDTYRQEDLYPLIGKTLADTFRTLLPEKLHDRIPDAAKMYSAHYPERSLRTTTLFPGVRETLMSLRAAGTRMAVASTKKGTGIRRATDHFGITGLFDQLQGSDGIPFKPDPFIVNKVITDQRWDRRDTIMVGDTDNDILAARNAGIATCAVTYGSFAESAIRSCAPDYIVHDFPALMHIVM